MTGPPSSGRATLVGVTAARPRRPAAVVVVVVVVVAVAVVAAITGVGAGAGAATSVGVVAAAAVAITGAEAGAGAVAGARSHIEWVGWVGSGIFRTPGLVAAQLGRPSLTFVAWIAGGALALLGALCFAELATRHPAAGGKYVYVREAFGPRAGFVVGWVEGLAIYPAAIA